MQTLERTQELGGDDGAGRVRKVRRLGLVATVVVVFVVTAIALYALGSSRATTKTVTKFVPKTVVAPAKGATAAPVDDRGYSKVANGEQAASGFYQAMDRTTQLALEHQLTLARQAAMRYPTVADAEAAGWRPAGPFAPGLGAHFFKYSGENGSGYVPATAMTDSNALQPASLIYDGTHPDSPIAGLMYLASGLGFPEGFAGGNDIWHYHLDVCVVPNSGGLNTPFGPDITVTKAMCDGVGGTLIGRTPYMLHAWVVPGYDSPQGVFSHDNEAITCLDGTYHMIPLTAIGDRRSVCADGGE
jgi:hypothetical protein